MQARQYSVSTARNREPILAVLRRIAPAGARVLEIASGTGEHAVFFAKNLSGVRWQPSDPDAQSRASIAAWIEAERAENVAPPLDLDVTRRVWPDLNGVDVMIAINMIHISPWEATLGLMAHAGALLEPGGVLYTYGPYKRDGRHTSISNEAFEAWLQERDPAYGVRDVGEVEAAANADGLMLREIFEMPANNLSLVFERQARD